MGAAGQAVLTSICGQPSHLYSATTVLKHQKGNCFDFSTLLCSMLIGAGYDAYCVNGYGSQDLCQMDLTRDVCPLTMKHKEVCGAPAALDILQDSPSLNLVCPCVSQPCPAAHRASAGCSRSIPAPVGHPLGTHSPVLQTAVPASLALTHFQLPLPPG